MIQTEEGYVTLSGTTPTYYYYLKDHQGNNRVVINQSGGVQQVNHYYAFGGLFGEGLQTANQPYRYNGKELDRFQGLNMYDYGARHYDALLGRWHVIDPLVEVRPWDSPYSYVGNNPISRIDPSGMIWEDSIQAQQLKKDVNNKINSLNEGIASRQNDLNKEGMTQRETDKLNKEITAMNDRISELNTSISDIDRLGNDPNNIYVLNDEGQLVGNVTRTEDGKVSINAGKSGLKLHEIKHIIQSLNAGGLKFNAGTNGLQYYAPGVQAEINAEMGAYGALFSYNGSFPGGVSIWSPKEITPQMIGNIRRSDGTLMYPRIKASLNR